MSEKKPLNLAKHSLPELQELLDRQSALMRNKKLLDRLKDKGESVTHLHEKIQKEIRHRNDVDNIQATLSNLNLSTSKDNAHFLQEKHVEYVCSKEKPIHDTRYRPHRTLIHKDEEKYPKKNTEITSALEPELRNEHVKFISLPDSLVIQNDQALKQMEEQAKKALSNFNDNQEESDEEEQQDAETTATFEDS